MFDGAVRFARVVDGWNVRVGDQPEVSSPSLRLPIARLTVVSTDVHEDVHPPDVGPFVGFLAERLQADHVVVLGGSELVFAAPHSTQVLGFDSARSLPAGWRSWDFASPLVPRLPDIDFGRAIACASDPLRPGGDDALVFGELGELARRCLLTIVSAPAGQIGDVDARLTSAGLAGTFSGVTRSADLDEAPRDRAVWVIENPSFPLTRTDIPTPDDFKVIAVVIAYNEEDVIEGTIEDLVAQGAHAYVVDNWSTDRTYELAERHLGRGVVGIERSPVAGPPDYFDLKSLLVRLEELTQIVEGDWFIKHDADEARRSPWPGVSLRDGLWRVQLAGYNCVDFTVLNFRPVDNSFVEGSSFVNHFTHFEFGAKPGHFRQFKAWRNFGQPIDYARFGSHRIDFAGLRVYPYKFLLRHYPVRSQQHGERKIFDERQARFLPEARKRGWHTQYDSVERGQSFLTDPTELVHFDQESFMEQYLVERLTGVGITRDETAPPSTSTPSSPTADGGGGPRTKSVAPRAKDLLLRIRRATSGERR